MQVVDGSRGGGQLVRAAVTSAALTGDAVRVIAARTSREPGGLKAQHVAAIAAIADICDADIDGVEIGATSFEFDPRTPTGGAYDVDIGTAGSIMLVFDTVLPVAATSLEESLELTVRGGTDVQWAPTLDFYRHVKRPILRQIGIETTLSVAGRGFYPAGGGEVTLTIEPSNSPPSPVTYTSRGQLESIRVHSTASTSLEDASVADRQATAASKHLPDELPAVEKSVTYVETRSPGSVLDLVVEFESSLAGFSALGRRGKPAAEVATDAVAALAGFRVTDAAVDRHIADQLLPFLGLQGGRIHAPTLTNHLETQAALLDQFGYDVDIERPDSMDAVVLSASPES